MAKEELEFMAAERRAEMSLMGQLQTQHASHFRWVVGVITLVFVVFIIILGALALDALSRKDSVVFYACAGGLAVCTLGFCGLVFRFNRTYAAQRPTHAPLPGNQIQ